MDEFHTFTTTNFSDMLAALRKYRVSLILVRQYLKQIDEETA
ncbi:MAG: hypothetical protein ACREOW_11320 [Thermodesulfobacteriota bacterium]